MGDQLPDPDPVSGLSVGPREHLPLGLVGLLQRVPVHREQYFQPHEHKAQAHNPRRRLLRREPRNVADRPNPKEQHPAARRIIPGLPPGRPPSGLLTLPRQCPRRHRVLPDSDGGLPLSLL